jgi:hypothetical protein
MIPPLSDELDVRLSERYQRLVQGHLGQAKATAAGLHALPLEPSGLAAAMAGWRFLHHPLVTLPRLAEPLLAHASKAMADHCRRHVLVVHDWSHLDYYGHSSKKDRLQGSTPREMGYEIRTTLAVDDATGQTLAVLAQDLEAQDGVHSSRFDSVQPVASHLDALADVFAFARQHTPARLTPVHIIDREGDSVQHLRAWHAQGHLFLVRGDIDRVVKHQGQERQLGLLPDDLEAAGAFRPSREVLYHGKKAVQRVAEAEVVLHRPGHQSRVQGEGAQKKTVKKRVKGEPLTLRLVVSRVYGPGGELLATWLLLSNAPGEVAAAEVALWYYWRWLIESYFKLLKSAGQEVEHWQQETGEAIARRLLVAAMACAVVWQLARDPAPSARLLRGLLIRLSGRQMGYGVEFTEEALLAGLWVYLAMLDVLEEQSPDDLRALAGTLFPGRFGTPDG